MLMDIAAIDDARRTAEGRQMGRLAARCCADVKDQLMRLGSTM